VATPERSTPVRQSCHGKTVAGIQVRTNNDLEMHAEDSRLSRLWEKFNDEALSQSIPDKAAGSPVYGVYTEFDDGVDADYSVLAGVEVTDEEKVPEDFAIVTLEAGEYLVFHGQGKMPETVVETWGQVWHYFDSEDAPERAFATDYEVYEGADQITIYIGVK